MCPLSTTHNRHYITSCSLHADTGCQMVNRCIFQSVVFSLKCTFHTVMATPPPYMHPIAPLSFCATLNVLVWVLMGMCTVGLSGGYTISEEICGFVSQNLNIHCHEKRNSITSFIAFVNKEFRFGCVNQSYLAFKRILSI